MNDTILDLMDRLRLLDMIQEDHFAIVKQVGADGIPDELPAKDDLGDRHTVHHVRAKYMDTYTLTASDLKAVVTVTERDNSISASFWDEGKEQCLAGIRVRLGASEDRFTEMMKMTGFTTIGGGYLRIILNALIALREATE